MDDETYSCKYMEALMGLWKDVAGNEWFTDGKS